VCVTRPASSRSCARRCAKGSTPPGFGSSLGLRRKRGRRSRRRRSGALVVPFPERPELHGALLLEPRACSRDDRLLLETLAAQAALAIGNARAWAEIAMRERRACEENAYLREAILPAADSERSRDRASACARSWRRCGRWRPRTPPCWCSARRAPARSW